MREIPELEVGQIWDPTKYSRPKPSREVLDSIGRVEVIWRRPGRGDLQRHACLRVVWDRWVREFACVVRA